MEKVVAVLCLLVLSVTAVDGYVEYTGVELPGFVPEENGEGEISTVEKVTIPESQIKEVVHYDHYIKLEISWENKTSGEYYFWVLDVTGQELVRLIGTKIKEDGFGEKHKVLYQRRELGAMFTLYSDSSDGEEYSSTGKYDIQRDEYTDLNEFKDERKLILTDTNANISVDELPSTNIPLSFYGFMRSYYDPSEEIVETLEDSVYGDDRVIELGDEGDFTVYIGNWPMDYTWVAERGEVISGYETLFINVSTDLGNENFSIPLSESLWIANDVAVPVKQYIRSYTEFESEDELSYILIENTFILQPNGFTAGTLPIPWGSCDADHWRSEHKFVETASWDGNYMPKSGSDFDDSSFDFKTEDLIEFLTTKDPVTNQYPSIELMNFLNNYKDSIIMRATYTADKDLGDSKTGEYWWNVTFGHKRDSDERGSDRDYLYRYELLVRQDTTREGTIIEPIYVNSFEIEEDYGIDNGSSPLSPDDISSQTVTLASSEKIFKTDDKIMEYFYPYEDLGITELDWGDGDETQYNLQTGQASSMDLIAILTGIQTQTSAEYYWEVSKEDLMSGGTMSSASLDAQTGRLISILHIEGTALQNAFKRG